MTRYLGPNVDPENLPDLYEYEDSARLVPSADSGKPDPWEHLDPRTKERDKDFSHKPHKASIKRCSHDGCPATYVDHRWGALAATGEGWFIQQNGISWCPVHNPPWVAEWRARKAVERPEN